MFGRTWAFLTDTPTDTYRYLSYMVSCSLKDMPHTLANLIQFHLAISGRGSLPMNCWTTCFTLWDGQVQQEHIMHDRHLATTLSKGLLCTRARRDIRLLKPLRKSQDFLSCLWRPVNDMKASAACYNLNYLCSKAQSVCELADLADCGFVDDWMLIQLLPHFNAGWMSANRITSQQHYVYISSVNGVEPLPYFAMASPWHVGVGKYSVQTCSDRQCQGYFWILLPCRTCVNPCSGVDMLSMSKQPQVATKTCPFRGVKRKKRRRCWKIATLRLYRSWTGVICHSGSMAWGATRFSDLLLRWKSASIKQWLEANKARMCMLFIVWIVVNETNHNKRH